MSLRWWAAGFFALLAGQLHAAPVISEIMADNQSTLVDEDGAYSDWIEIHNPDAAPVSLDGWYLTDKSGNLTQWQFPAVSVEPGGFLVVWASGKNRRVPGSPLHTNFSLAKDGEFLALVRPGGTLVEQSFSPEFPALDADEAFGARFQSTTLVAQGATGKYRVPSSSTNPAATWNQASFNDSSWTSGTSGYGFGIKVPGMTIRKVSKNGYIGGLTDALNLIGLAANDPSILKTTTVVWDKLNILGEESDGHFGFNQPLPDEYTDNYVVVATGSVVIPTAGAYTFGLNSDDGGRILIDGAEIMRDDSFHGPEDHLGTVTLSAGSHTFQAVMFEGGGGDCVEFFAAQGTYSSFDAAAFRLVGDVPNGGLAATTTPSGAGNLIGTNLSSPMSGRNGAYIRMPFTASGPGSAGAMSLLLRYNDGLKVWLNGNQVAAINSPASPAWNSVATAARTDEQALLRQPVNLTSWQSSLVNGANTLAIHGMRMSTADTNFLVLPELVIGTLDAGLAPAFYGNGLSTPGWINGATSSLGDVADTVFSVDRGFFTAPFQLQITCATPGAQIRYTTDGSTPGETNGSVYSGPITISSTTVLRARALLAGWNPTDVDTHTYLFPNDVITQSANGSPAPGWPSDSGTSQVLDYGMDPEIVNHPDPQVGGVQTVKSALLALPSISLTTDLPNLFDMNGSQGIYSHPYERGFAWEKPASIEWINPPDATHPNGNGEFQINAGVRLRGGFSRSEDNPKHAFRLFFREEYGDTKLRYPLFGRDGAQEFDKIDLRTSQNYSWSFQNDDRNTFLREEACRQAMLDMGQPGSHVRYVHLYLNGRYWGLYDLDERTEASFSESYLGGNKDDYDVIKAQQESDYTVGPTDGDLAAWQDLWNKSKAHRASPTNANYFRMMGLAANGVTPTADPVLLDPDNLIDYLLLTIWSGNLDGCVSAFLGEQRGNNWFGSRMRVNNPRQGFRFFVHDFEHSLLETWEDRSGPFTNSAESEFIYSNPMFLHQDLTGNLEYRMRWADRIHRHMFGSGALTPAAWTTRIQKLATQVDAAIAAESARWGDAKNTTPYTRLHWLQARDNLYSYLPVRNPEVLAQLRADSLYPNLDAPVLSPDGGYQAVGSEVLVQGAAGATVYFMADGSDPRLVGGGVKAGAQVYSSTTTSAALVPWSAGSWKFLGNGSNPGISWRDPAFNDSAWSVGTAELGYGDGDEATTVPIVDVDPVTPGTQKAATCYFRRAFNVTDRSKITNLSLTIEYDDAHAVYLNGTRVAGNLPENPAFDYYTGNTIDDETETISIPPNLLVDGPNLIAVEVHQSFDTSSDLSMNLSLTGTRVSTTTPVYLSGTGQRTLRFRSKSGSNWSALAESVYQVGTTPPAPGMLVVSEISYRPPDPHGEAEFIELRNIGTQALDLAGATFTEGIDFTFPAGTTLPGGARVLVVKNTGAFQVLYGTGKPIAGQFANDTTLSNSGERLRLENANGVTLFDFTYGTTLPWPDSADGAGRSLVLPGGDPSIPGNWRPSAATYGNPGTTDEFPRAPGQGLLAYALADETPGFDPVTGVFSVKRRLGADSATLRPEWSPDGSSWFTDSLTLWSETVDGAGNSLLSWKLAPLPPGRAFLRVRVTETP